MQKEKIHFPYNRFKVWLKDNELTYADIAAILGITATSVMYKINGQSDFLLSEVKLIAKKYGIKYSIFFGDYVA